MAVPRWAWVVIAIIVLCVFGIIAMAGAGIYFVTKQVQVRTASPASADTLFQENRERFKDAKPLIELDPDGDVVAMRLRDAKDDAARHSGPSPTLEALHVMAWDANDEKVVEIAIPFWLLRLKKGPIEVFSETAGLRNADLRLTVDDLESLGPSLLIDQRGRHGDRVLVWTQ
jgi:uncharacterized membrane protein